MSLIDRIKSNFALFGIVGAIILVIVLMFISSLIEDAVKPGSGSGGSRDGSRNGRDGGTDLPYTVTGGNLKVSSVSPSDMPREVVNTFDIIAFEFSEPVDPETLEIEVAPTIELRTNYNENYPNRISILPAKTGWKSDTLYEITIVSLKSSSGEDLNEPFEYEYFNIQPDLSDFDPPY